MNIWLVNPYGAIPGEGWREYRFTMLAKALVEHGHNVIWWTANYSHNFKRFRSRGWADIPVSQGFLIRLVPTVDYVKNVSLARIWFEVVFAYRMYKRAKKEQFPDMIIAGEPPQSVSYAAVKLAQYFSTQLVLDVGDIWPELFVLAIPRFFRPVSYLLFSPFYGLRRYNLRNANAVVAVCNTYLKLVQKEAPFLSQERAETVFWGVDVADLRRESSTIEAPAEVRWKHKLPGEVWAIYAGTLGNNYDILTLLQVVALLQQRRSTVKIIIAGAGPLQSHIADYIKTNGSANIEYLGKLETSDLGDLYRICDIGLCPYAEGSTVAMPIKVFDYLAVGLPIISSLHGDLESLLSDRQVGIQYESGNPSSLADALEILATNEDRRKLMARNSYNTAMEFDQKIQYQKFVALVERVVSDGLISN